MAKLHKVEFLKHKGINHQLLAYTTDHVRTDKHVVAESSTKDHYLVGIANQSGEYIPLTFDMKAALHLQELANGLVDMFKDDHAAKKNEATKRKEAKTAEMSAAYGGTSKSPKIGDRISYGEVKKMAEWLSKEFINYWKEKKK